MINLDNLREIAGGDEEFIVGVLRLFVSKENEYAETIRQAMERKDLEELRQIVHKVKSSVSVIGMSGFSAQLNSLEKRLLENRLSLGEAEVEAEIILNEFFRAENEVKSLLQQMRPDA